MFSTILNTEDSPRSIPYQLNANLNSTIDELRELFYPTYPSSYDITNQIPLWIIHEKQDRQSTGTTSITIFDFLQKYYDWLYSDESIGAQYELSKKFLDIIDVEKTRSTFLERLSAIYANGFDTNSLIKNGGIVDENNLRNFIKNIRRAFYHKKTTEDGIRYFFQTLFGVEQEEISIDIPKKIMLRLNGGRFASDEYLLNRGNTGSYESLSSLSGSYLNGSRLQDSNWIQEWSYLLKVGIGAHEYKNSYLEMAHPAGMKVVFEKTLLDYRGPTYDETVPFVCELPLLKNYAPYRILFDYQNSIQGITYSSSWKDQGISFIGLTFSTGCCGICYGYFKAPTYLFPNWTDQVTTTDFRDININTMFEMCYPSELGSPNQQIPACS